MQVLMLDISNRAGSPLGAENPPMLAVQTPTPDTKPRQALANVLPSQPHADFADTHTLGA